MQLLTTITQLLTRSTDQNYWPELLTTQPRATITQLLTRTTDQNYWPHNHWPQSHNYWPELLATITQLLTRTTDQNYWPHNHWPQPHNYWPQLLTSTTEHTPSGETIWLIVWSVIDSCEWKMPCCYCWHGTRTADDSWVAVLRQAELTRVCECIRCGESRNVTRKWVSLLLMFVRPYVHFHIFRQ
jgi:hypothetical protein